MREYIKWANADTKEDAEKRLEQRYRELRKTRGGVARRRNMAYEGDARAQFALGCEVTREMDKVSAQENEGLISKETAVLRRNNVRMNAWPWFDIAQANGFPLAKKNKDLLENKMTAKSISKAQETRQEMVKKNPKLLKKYSKAQELSEEMLNAKKNPELLKKK